MFKKSSKFIVLLLIVVMALSMVGCGEPQKEQADTSTSDTDTSDSSEEKVESLLVFSGAGLRKPMDEIGKAFQEKTGIEIQYTYAGSAQNLSQLELSGEGDLYVPGSLYYFKSAQEKGLVENEKDVAYHVPVITVPKENPANIKTLEDLAKPGVKVTLGDPKSAAIGKVAMKMFEKNKIKDKVLENLVSSAATVNELVVYVTMKQADASIIWEDNVVNVPEIKSIQIPEKQNMIKTIPVCTLKSSEKKEAAEEFLQFVTSKEGKAIFEKHGFKSVE